jgi:hypothetical protein
MTIVSELAVPVSSGSTSSSILDAPNCATSRPQNPASARAGDRRGGDLAGQATPPPTSPVHLTQVCGHGGILHGCSQLGCRGYPRLSLAAPRRQGTAEADRVSGLPTCLGTPAVPANRR